MKDYTYEKPSGSEYKISLKEWNKVFGNRGRPCFVYVVAYVDGDTIITHYYYRLLAKIVITLLYPLIVVTDGYKDAGRQVKRSWFDKATGDFSSDITYRRHTDSWGKMEKLIGRKL